MQIKTIAFAVCAAVLPMVSFAQDATFESLDSCKSLRQEITAAVEETHAIANLLTDKSPELDVYLAQLYEGIKLLSKSGEMFFKASDSHESDCKTRLTQAGKLDEVRKIYDWYLEPTQIAYQFFKRARDAAISLNRQQDVDTFSKTMTEYDAAIMKLVGVCESDLANSPHAATCTALQTKLTDVLK